MHTCICTSPLFDSHSTSQIISHAVDRGFASRPGHTKDHHKNRANCLLTWHTCVKVSIWQPDYLKGRVLCGTVYMDMFFKYRLGSITREAYRIPVADFYLVLHDPRYRKSTIVHFKRLVSRHIHKAIEISQRDYMGNRPKT